MIISYGGGVQSTALVILAMQQGWEVEEIIHVDLLEAESPATRRYVAYIRNWLKRNYRRDITIIERDLYGDMLRNPKFTPVPWIGKRETFMLSRQCTRQYKVAPVQSYITNKYDYAKLALGISVDEYHRMRDSGHSRIEHIYPLIDLRLSRDDCKTIISKAGVDLAPKSSCWFCPYKRASEQERLVQQYPELIERAIVLEQAINEARSADGKPEIIVLKVDTKHRQSDMFAECEMAGFCDA